jgi:hypothetical protein
LFAPKRHHVTALVAEVKRLAAIALTAGQLLGGVGASTKPMVETGLRRTIKDTKRSERLLHTKPPRPDAQRRKTRRIGFCLIAVATTSWRG